MERENLEKPIKNADNKRKNAKKNNLYESDYDSSLG
jgi:hypothetical protein